MNGISEEMVQNLSNIDTAMTNLEDAVEEFLEKRPQYDQLTQLEKARDDLATLFAINSCYWSYLHLKGKDPADDAELAAELKRNKKYNEELKKFEDLDKRPKYEGKTVGRFVKHALYDMHAAEGSGTSSQCQSRMEDEEEENFDGGNNGGNGEIVEIVSQEEQTTTTMIIKEEEEAEDMYRGQGKRKKRRHN